MGKTLHPELVYEFGPFRLDTGGRTLRRGEQTVSLAPKAYEMLLVLVRYGGRVVSKQELMDAVWPDTYVEESSLTTNIFVIRKALSGGDDAPDDQSYIETLPKRGYRLTSPVRVRNGGNPNNGDEPRRQQATDEAASAPAEVASDANGGGAGASPAAGGVAFDDSAGRAGDEAATSGSAGRAPTNGAAEVAVIGAAGAAGAAGAVREVGEVGREARRAGDGARRRRRAWLRWALPAVAILIAGFGLFGQWEAARQLDALREQQQQWREEQSAALPEGARAEARRLYLTGRYFWNKRDDSHLPKSVALYKRALELDPGFTPPYAGLADVYAFDSYQSGRWREAEELARKAIGFDPTRGEPHASLGFVLMFHHWDWEGAEREFRTAIELDPGYATAHHWYATLLEVTGRLDEAKARIRRAAELDPTSLPINADIAEVYNAARDYKQAEEYARAALDLDPVYPAARQHLDVARAGQGVFDAAAGNMPTTCAGVSPAATWNVRDQFRLAGCERILREYLPSQRDRDPARVAYHEARMRASLGENEEAFAQLELAHRHHNFFLIFVKVDSAFDGLRADPRFQQLLRRMNLPAD